MPSNPHTGMGAQLQKGDGNSPETFTAIMGIKSISGPSIKRDTFDTTSLNSPDGFREFIGGMSDGGEVSFEAQFLQGDDAHQGYETGGFLSEFLKGSCNSRGNWRITLPECDGEPTGHFAFAGVVTGAGFNIDDTLMGFTGTIKVSGKPDLVFDGV